MRLDYSWLGPFVFAFLSSRTLRLPVPTPRFFRPPQLVSLLRAASPPLLFILHSPVPCPVSRVPFCCVYEWLARVSVRPSVRPSTASERGLGLGPPARFTERVPSASRRTRAYQCDVLPRAKAGSRHDRRPVDPGRPFIQGGRLRAYDCAHTYIYTYIHACLLAPSHSRVGNHTGAIPPAGPSASVRSALPANLSTRRRTHVHRRRRQQQRRRLPRLAGVPACASAGVPACASAGVPACASARAMQRLCPASPDVPPSVPHPTRLRRAAPPLDAPSPALANARASRGRAMARARAVELVRACWHFRACVMDGDEGAKRGWTAWGWGASGRRARAGGVGGGALETPNVDIRLDPVRSCASVRRRQRVVDGREEHAPAVFTPTRSDVHQRANSIRSHLARRRRRRRSTVPLYDIAYVQIPSARPALHAPWSFRDARAQSPASGRPESPSESESASQSESESASQSESESASESERNQPAVSSARVGAASRDACACASPSLPTPVELALRVRTRCSERRRTAYRGPGAGLCFVLRGAPAEDEMGWDGMGWSGTGRREFRNGAREDTRRVARR
ncbi:hypothetical protein HETIRDRAFT_447416 [Heterobasidion irregulare TC 32-1]|uniref:Uncharacterized protein n=1 Tax=Heterobasidion irregulare (strain TC 32-1) TaxID=747525 RepID=W4KLN7_HETIT|nr:uncharacterized protein HETIRDRAFT_447416 [Heterobasidion irregulare TC 32-1]ETW86737.1 hypothetical protein HETIRDRAFT_447416 [Heterobasidion irregulare TC 32-1]